MYVVNTNKRIDKQIARFEPGAVRASLLKALEDLKADPRPAKYDWEPYRGIKGAFKIKVRSMGRQFRIAYMIDDATNTISVLEVVDRKNAYRGH